MTSHSNGGPGREIGGYFELEMSPGEGPLHTDRALALNSARSCLGLLVDEVRPSVVWAPYYICAGALAPLTARSVAIRHYEVDQDLNPVGLGELAEDERLIYVNYFGLKTTRVLRLAEQYGHRLWADHVQDFFFIPTNTGAYHYNSARKFFGVTDGAYLYAPDGTDEMACRSFDANTHYRLDHLLLRLAGSTQAGRQPFEQNEELNGREIAGISNLGAALLARLDYRRAAECRRANFDRLHRALGATNRLPAGLLTLASGAVPFCYPYMPERPIERQVLWDRRIYVPTLWAECATASQPGYEWEKTLSKKMLPLPTDQRYGPDDMDRIIGAIRDR